MELAAGSGSRSETRAGVDPVCKSSQGALLACASLGLASWLKICQQTAGTAATACPLLPLTPLKWSPAKTECDRVHHAQLRPRDQDQVVVQ